MSVSEGLSDLFSGVGFGVPDVRFQVPGSKFLIRGLRFQVPGSGFGVPGSGFRVWDSGFTVSGSRFRFPGSGFRVPESDSVKVLWFRGSESVPLSLHDVPFHALHPTPQILDTNSGVRSRSR